MADDKPESIRDLIAHSQCEYRRLGGTGFRVSVPILGAMSFGTKKWADWVIEEEEALPLLKAAWDRGLTSWDTANVYSAGESERIIGKALKKYEIPRHRVEILTKCFATVTDDPGMPGMQYGQEIKGSRDYKNERGLSRAAIFNAVHASLERLQTPYIDLLQIHRFDADTPIEETMEALHDLVRSGKVRYIGASSMWTFQFAMMQGVAERNGWTKFVSMQNHYNLLYREEEREMNRYCRLTGVGLIPWAPLARGHLARPPSAFGSTTRSAAEKSSPRTTGVNVDADAKAIEKVEELAKKHGWKMSSVALAWINKRVTSPIIGFSSIERMDEAIEARGKELTEEEEKYLEEGYVPKEVTGHS